MCGQKESGTGFGGRNIWAEVEFFFKLPVLQMADVSIIHHGALWSYPFCLGRNDLCTNGVWIIFLYSLSSLFTSNDTTFFYFTAFILPRGNLAFWRATWGCYCAHIEIKMWGKRGMKRWRHLQLEPPLSSKLITWWPPQRDNQTEAACSDTGLC